MRRKREGIVRRETVGRRRTNATDARPTDRRSCARLKTKQKKNQRRVRPGTAAAAAAPPVSAYNPFIFSFLSLSLRPEVRGINPRSFRCKKRRYNIVRLLMHVCYSVWSLKNTQETIALPPDNGKQRIFGRLESLRQYRRL